LAVTVSGKNYLQISNCDTASSGGTWSGATFTPDANTKKEGVAALSCILKASGNNIVTFTPTVAKDLTGIKHLRLWLLSTHGGLLNTMASGGIQFWVSDGTNTGYYYVSGKDTYPGGWINLVCDLSRAVDAGTKPSAMNAITSMGFVINLTKLGKNAINTWFDNFIYADGLIVYGEYDTGAITCNINATNGTFTRTVGDFVADGFKVGQDFTSSGFANGGNNTRKTISALTTTVITVTDKTGLVTESGSGDEKIKGYFGFEDICNADNATTGGWGIARKISGIYFLTGMIEIGRASGGTDNCKFQSKSKTVVFEDRRKSDTVSNINVNLYSLNIVDNGTGTTEFNLGSVSGTSGIEGCSIRVADLTQIPKFDILGNNSNVDNLKMCGTTFLDADSIEMPANGANVFSLNCNFESCGEVLPKNSTITNCNFISPNNMGVRITNKPHYVTKCDFVTCPRGVNLTLADSSQTFTDLVFTSCTYDVINNSGITITVSKEGTSNPSTYDPGGSQVNFSGSVPISITCKNEAGNSIKGVRVRIEKQSDHSLIKEGYTNSSGTFTDSYTGGTPLDVKVIVRLKSYKFASALTQIIAVSGLTVPFTMITDSIVNLP